MKILIKILSHGIGHQIVDAWHAYVQHLNGYSNNTEYVIINSNDTDTVKNNDYNLSILLGCLGDQITDKMVTTHDIVLICNGGEPIMVSSPAIKELLNHKNVFLVANSYLTQDHELKNKVVWFPSDVQTCRDYWTRHFYPQYFDSQNWKKNKKTNSVCYINGANRSPRQLFIDYLQDLKLDIKIKNNLTSQIAEIGESQWESVEDSEFRLWVNQQYNSVLLEKYDNPYYDNSPSIGIHDKFGKIAPGYFHLPVYFENFCVVFPETTWQNNELCITEKSLKCFYAETLPLPVSGANVNQLYNDLGFYTAWNLLPKKLQKFDHVLDHKQRYLKLSQAVEWLIKNPEVFASDQYTEMTQKNKINFLTCECDYRSIIEFDRLLSRFIKPNI
jgi:hypothetical protein